MHGYQSSMTRLPDLSSESRDTYTGWITTIKEGLEKIDRERFDSLDSMHIGSIESTLKNVRNTLIGNQYMKQNFVDLGLLPVIRAILLIDPKDSIKHGLLEWQIHALTIVGTVAKGTTVLLIKGESLTGTQSLQEMDFSTIIWELLIRFQTIQECPESIVTAIWRTLRIIYKNAIASTEIAFKVQSVC